MPIDKNFDEYNIPFQLNKTFAIKSKNILILANDKTMKLNSDDNELRWSECDWNPALFEEEAAYFLATPSPKLTHYLYRPDDKNTHQREEPTWDQFYAAIALP